MKVKSHWDFNASKENNLRLGLCYIHIDIFFLLSLCSLRFLAVKTHTLLLLLSEAKISLFSNYFFHSWALHFYSLLFSYFYFCLLLSLSTHLSVCIWLTNYIFCFSDLILYIHVGKLCLFLCLYVTNTFSFSFFYLCES